MAKNKSADGQKTLELKFEQPASPPFLKLLENPVVSEPLPRDFDRKVETDHLSLLWDNLNGLWNYAFEAFIHAGGSGMVFRVRHKKSGTVQALKVARNKLLHPQDLPTEAAETLSPVPDNELLALQTLAHPNVVSLDDAFSYEGRVVAISTTYVDDPQPLDTYFKRTLEKTPRGIHPFAPVRLDRACGFLIEKSIEIADALAHMHGQGIYHFDVKPANILISSARRAVLTDLGACVHIRDLEEHQPVRVHFTWTYAHPDLTSILHDPASISGGGLKASAEIATGPLGKYDLFALGRTLQQALALLEKEFGERAYAINGFRFLHFIAAMMLDGKNAPSPENVRVTKRDGSRFVADTALDYPTVFFAAHRIDSAEDLLSRLRRFSREFSWNAEVPELDTSQPKAINTGLSEMAPFTKRVAALLGHPALRRLKNEPQLGWIREVFPAATHDRWSHTIGVFGAVVQYYNSLLSDPDVPTLRVVLERKDIVHAMVAALLHDIGQIGFGHDLEAACPHLFQHEEMIPRLLQEKAWSSTSLNDILEEHWPEVEIARVLAILRRDASSLQPVDWLAADVIDGPIDADKFDYLQRDSAGCGVSYGAGFDETRFLRALSVDAKIEGGHCKLGLAYKAKGAPAIESLLLVRYQMYGAVYWHHTFRCIQAMFAHAAAVTFGPLKHGRRKLRYTNQSASSIQDLLYHWVLCGKSVQETTESLRRAVPQELAEDTPSLLNGERVLEFVWKFSNNSCRDLLTRLGSRDLYKRIFEVKVADLGPLGDYSALSNDLQAEHRPELAAKIQGKLLAAVYSEMTSKGPVESATEEKARSRYQDLQKAKLPLVILDFPIKGISNERNFPPELGDPARKYLSGRPEQPGRYNVFHVVRELQTQRATLRVFAAPELHELVVRYLAPSSVEACVAEVIERIRVHR